MLKSKPQRSVSRRASLKLTALKSAVINRPDSSRMKRSGNAASSVSLGPTNGGAAYGIAVKLAISLPGLVAEQKKLLVDTAHQVCPYSNATRGNIDVELQIV